MATMLLLWHPAARVTVPVVPVGREVGGRFLVEGEGRLGLERAGRLLQERAGRFSIEINPRTLRERGSRKLKEEKF